MFIQNITFISHVYVHLQSFIDIFFIDWERPQGKVVSAGGSAGESSYEVPVSIWRTYFVANEWNEIQTVRQINPVFQYFTTLLFLSSVGFGNIATMDPRNDFDLSDAAFVYHAPMSKILRFACIGIVYLTVGQSILCFISNCHRCSAQGPLSRNCLILNFCLLSFA